MLPIRSVESPSNFSPGTAQLIARPAERNTSVALELQFEHEHEVACSDDHTRQADAYHASALIDCTGLRPQTPGGFARRARSASPRLYRPYKSECIAALLPQRKPGALPRLEAQLKLADTYLDEKKQPDLSVLNGDMQTMPDFAAMENIKHPGLNLFVADSVSALHALLGAMPPQFHLRCVFKLSGNARANQHHIYADIQRKPTGPISFIVLESTNVNENLGTARLLWDLITRLDRDARFCNRRMTCFDTRVQKSSADCLIFCIDFALKAHRHEWEFAQLHATHYDGRAIGNEANDSKMNVKNRKFYSIAPADFLPFSFFEYAQSTQALRCGFSFNAANRSLLEQTQKMQAQQEIRITPCGEKHYPASIEYRRRQFLTQAITAIAGASHPD